MSRAGNSERDDRRERPVRRSPRPDGSRWWFRLGCPRGGPWSAARLVLSAAAGGLSAHRAASTPPSTRYLVLTADVAAGTTVSADHLGSVALDLPGELAAVQETEAANILGRVAATGLDELDLLRPSDLHEPGRFADPDAVEVALDLPSSRAMLGALERGDRVEVLATDPAAAGTDRVAAATVVDQGDDRAGRHRFSVDGDGSPLAPRWRGGGSGGRCLGPRRGHARSAGTGRRGAGPMNDRFVLIGLARSRQGWFASCPLVHRSRGPDRLPEVPRPRRGAGPVRLRTTDLGAARRRRVGRGGPGAVRAGVVIGRSSVRGRRRPDPSRLGVPRRRCGPRRALRAR